MNMNIFFARIILLTTLLLTIFYGCKYNVAEPMWDSPPAVSEEVTITGIVPAQASPGVNVITILGTNLSGALDTTMNRQYSYHMDTVIVNGVLTIKKDSTLISQSVSVYNGVYFDNVQATVIEKSSSMIKVLRPNLSGDTIRIKIVSKGALVTAKSGAYKIDKVMQQFGAFNENYQLGAIAVDKDENVYVLKGITPFSVFKITPTGDKTNIGTATRLPSDAKVGLDGKLYYLTSAFPNTKEIRRIDLQTGVDSLWFTFAPVKNVICGDFDANGYFYTGGRRSGIQILRPNRSKRDDGYYVTDTILSMRVFNGYVYAATRTAIYRHSISDTSKVGAPEPVLNLTQGIFASRLIKAFSFSADGSKMYVGTDSPNPILVVDMTTQQSEILYQGILPSYCKQFCFGDKLYMISGNVTPAVNWIVYKVDVGKTGAPYY